MRIYMYIYISIHLHMYVYIYTYTYMHLYILTCIYAQAPIQPGIMILVCHNLNVLFLFCVCEREGARSR